MYWLEVIGFFIFIILMTIGYKRGNRNIMLGASICLIVALAGPDFISGVSEGFKDATSR
ncbi:MAG: hypothetical protein ABJK64_01170 [Paraglaciecola sp.]|uniref:hypothetical protein n=1 Tax=Paraglaciecola sp. TaxID=1920173 RepID=UPI0032970809